MGAGKTILIVQSQIDVATLLKLILEGEGYNVMCAHNGNEVFKRIADQKPDLIFLGVDLSDVNVELQGRGLVILSQLKDSAVTSSIPVVMLTGNREEQLTSEAFKRGADGYITKPFKATEIISEAHRLLGPPS